MDPRPGVPKIGIECKIPKYFSFLLISFPTLSRQPNRPKLNFSGCVHRDRIEIQHGVFGNDLNFPCDWDHCFSVYQNLLQPRTFY
ncbi:hypothetical protein Pyn_14062 [Prunus yedoensis var. nudiflora]|uniref:Uncharacterized protein n=1 Tax=Prunus yedoensis var. nudiflora TaxID=2094558 RepID=A0A314YTG2_PRUYE|nr:hypothetical protein Pyn_14062 [Prunus yedoensis var. nudiflora]